jgi:hypothetical protein
MSGVPTTVTIADAPEVRANGGILPNSFLNPSWISLKYDLGIPSDATITGVGSPSSTDAGYGTINLPAFGAYSAQTVTQRIQAALDRAASGPVGILWDVACAIGTPGVPGLSGDQMLAALTLRRPGNLHIQGRPGCGAILRAQCNAAMLANELPTFGTASLNVGTDQQVNTIGNINFGDVTIEGLYLNANSGVSASTASAPNQTEPDPRPDLLPQRDAAVRGPGRHVPGLLVRGRVRVPPVSSATGSGSGPRTCASTAWATATRAGGNDCFHLNGPGDDFIARDCRLATNDDYYALNTADGNNHSGRNHGPTVPAWGSITRVRAYNTRVTSRPIGNFARIMAAGGCVNDGHEFAGVTGVCRGLAWLVNSSSAGATPGAIGQVTFRDLDVDITAVGIRNDAAPIGEIRRLLVDGVYRRGSSLVIPLVHVTRPIRHLDLRDIYSLDDGTSGASKPVVLVESPGSVTDFSAMGVGLDGSGGTQDMPILRVAAGASVTLARVTNASTRNVAALVSNAGTVARLVVSNTDPAAVACTGTAPASTSGDYFADALPPPTTYLDDTFTGTSGATLTGSAPAPHQNGSDVWGDLASAFGTGLLAFDGGGPGCHAAGHGTAGVALASYPLTGVPQAQTASFTFRSASGSASNVLIQMLRDTPGDTTITITADYGNQKLTVNQIVSGASTPVAAPSFTWLADTTYTVAATYAAGTLTVSVDGVTVVSGAVTIGTGRILLIGEASAVGNVHFLRVTVTA